MQADEERVVARGLDGPNGLVTQQVGEVASRADRLCLPGEPEAQILATHDHVVPEIVCCALDQTEEGIIAMRGGTLLRRFTQMPLADQRGAVAARLEHRGDGRCALGNADALRRSRPEGFLEAHRKALLIAPGEQCGTGG